ncbi:proton-coupled zinc antiporter SLC30A5-like [Bacillus rossius redtenbacheri]|uniref:proton-coupled zinc antiporter SLC30A5-like n=1 Tax=Bacillus rossius redtenbacheri TaxID=93214 RepID=UPI002FDDEB5B
MFVVDYYADAVCSQRLDVQQVARAGSMSVFACALVAALAWHGTSQQEAADHGLSWGGVLACILFTLSTLGLTSGSRAGAQGSLVGFSSAGLPLYTLTSSALHQSSRSAARLLASVLRQTLDSPHGRRIFYFLCLNLSFTLVEFAYGLWTNSLGLISDAFHMLFDCSALVLGLLAAVLARRKPSKTFSYGYGRAEELSGFVNGLLLLVVSLVVLWEAASRLLDPPRISTRRLLAVSTAGLCVNLVGIVAFRHSHSSHQHSHGSHGHSHNANMEGVFLHVLADTLGSVGVIVSSLLIDQLGWYVADPICSLFIASLIFLSVLPLLRRSAAVLVLSAPAELRQRVPTVLEQVRQHTAPSLRRRAGAERARRAAPARAHRAGAGAGRGGGSRRGPAVLLEPHGRHQRSLGARAGRAGRERAEHPAAGDGDPEAGGRAPAVRAGGEGARPRRARQLPAARQGRLSCGWAVLMSPCVPVADQFSSARSACFFIERPKETQEVGFYGHIYLGTAAQETIKVQRVYGYFVMFLTALVMKHW